MHLNPRGLFYCFLDFVRYQTHSSVVTGTARQQPMPLMEMEINSAAKDWLLIRRWSEYSSAY